MSDAVKSKATTAQRRRLETPASGEGSACKFSIEDVPIRTAPDGDSRQNTEIWAEVKENVRSASKIYARLRGSILGMMR